MRHLARQFDNAIGQSVLLLKRSVKQAILLQLLRLNQFELRLVTIQVPTISIVAVDPFAPLVPFLSLNR
jgi:hypothetical protein